MKKVIVFYSATIEKTLEISDEMYAKIENDDFDYWAMTELFEKAPDGQIYLNDCDGIEDEEKGEYIFEY